MTSNTTISAYLKALGRLAHPRYSCRQCLSSHIGSWRKKGSHDFRYCPIRPSEGSRQTGTIQVFPVVPCLSCQSCSRRSSTSYYLELAQGHVIKTNTKCTIAREKLTRKLATRHLETAQLGR